MTIPFPGTSIHGGTSMVNRVKKSCDIQSIMEPSRPTLKTVTLFIAKGDEDLFLVLLSVHP